MTIAMRGSPAGGDSPQDNQTQSAAQNVQAGSNPNQQVSCRQASYKLSLGCLFLAIQWFCKSRGNVTTVSRCWKSRGSRHSRCERFVWAFFCGGIVPRVGKQVRFLSLLIRLEDETFGSILKTVGILSIVGWGRKCDSVKQTKRQNLCVLAGIFEEALEPQISLKKPSNVMSQFASYSKFQLIGKVSPRKRILAIVLFVRRFCCGILCCFLLRVPVRILLESELLGWECFQYSGGSLSFRIPCS